MASKNTFISSVRSGLSAERMGYDPCNANGVLGGLIPAPSPTRAKYLARVNLLMCS